MEYTLENEYLKLTVASRGAEVVSLVRKSDGVEHIWQADPTVWGCHAPVLFPHCGKVVDGMIHAKGRDFAAKQHGFAREMETYTRRIRSSKKKTWYVYRFNRQARITSFSMGNC